MIIAAPAPPQRAVVSERTVDLAVDGAGRPRGRLWVLEGSILRHVQGGSCNERSVGAEGSLHLATLLQQLWARRTRRREQAGNGVPGPCRPCRLSGALLRCPGHPAARDTSVMPSRRRRSPVTVPISGFAGFRSPPDVILPAVRWYLRSRCPTATWRSCRPSEASRSTTSPSSGGCGGSRRS
jgi:hypothetical protein